MSSWVEGIRTPDSYEVMRTGTLLTVRHVPSSARYL
jgi:hypothetical protein